MSGKQKIVLWRDRVQTRWGQHIIWVVLVEDNFVKETLNANDPHTDPVEAILFAKAESQRRGVEVTFTILDV